MRNLTNFLDTDSEELSKMDKFAKRIRFVSEKYPKIASGSSRVVFDINDKFVLKLAKNEKGIAQNETENDWVLQSSYESIIAPIYKSADDGTWLVSFKAKKMTKSLFKAILGYSFDDFGRWLIYYYYEHNPNRYIRPSPVNQELEELISASEFGFEIKNLMLDFDMPYGDLVRISSYGELGGRVVLVDYGLNQQTYDTFYNRLEEQIIRKRLMEDLRDWFKEKWVRIDTQGNITGDCGTMKDDKKTTRCLPEKKAKSLSKAERKATVAKKTKSDDQFVKNTEKAEYKRKD